MIRIWPWTKFAELEHAILWRDSRLKERLFHVELYRNIAHQSMRDLAAANKGIRRLKAKLAKYEKP
jgi:hypothetical protein